MGQSPYLYIIVMMHLTYAGALLIQRRDTQDESGFAYLFAISWGIEAVRAAILFPYVQETTSQTVDLFALSDMLCPVATWFLLAATASLANVKLSWRLGIAYMVLTIPVVVFGRYGFPIVATRWLGFTTEAANFYGVLGNLVFLFVPVTIARIFTLYWLFQIYERTKLSGALIATIFAVPYAILAIAVPFQFYFYYYPSWINFLWAFRVFGFSIGLVMLRLSMRQAQLYKLNNELDLRIQRRTAELQERNDELEMFSRTISHDLRTPLNAMRMFVSALQSVHDRTLSPTGRDCVQNIDETIGLMDSLIADLLSYSQVARDELPLEPVDMDNVLAMAKHQLDVTIEQHGAKIETVTKLPIVYGNQTILVQILVNLISNGIKFVEDVLPEIQISAENLSGRHRIWISDNGIGIPDDCRNHVFDPFERLHDGGHFKGSGIGLAIVKRGCERIGGECGVESESGKGSRFWIEFPAVAKRDYFSPQTNAAKDASR